MAKVLYHKDRFVCRAVCQELAGATVSLKDIARARDRRKRDLHQLMTARRSLIDQVLASPAAVLRPEPMAVTTPVALPPSTIKRYAQD